MKIVVCISNNNGMMFNHRRQSKDKNLTKKILEMTKNDGLIIYPYSEPLFDGQDVEISEFPLAHSDKYVFIEEPMLIPPILFTEIIVCKWGRDYPADQFLNIDMTQYQLLSTEEFVGNSHPEMTIEKWIRK